MDIRKSKVEASSQLASGMSIRIGPGQDVDLDQMVDGQRVRDSFPEEFFEAPKHVKKTKENEK